MLFRDRHSHLRSFQGKVGGSSDYENVAPTSYIYADFLSSYDRHTTVSIETEGRKKGKTRTAREFAGKATG